MNRISTLVKNQRLNLGLTMEQVAKSADLSQTLLSRVEAGDYDTMKMSLDTIIRLAKALQLKVKDFLDNLEITEPNHIPELSVYLRQKYDINKSHDIQMIESIINRLKENEEK